MQEDTQVLIAEDDDEDFIIFSEAVDELPFSVILSRAENGEILLKILHNQLPDILFLDILMPLKDGRQCLREIRSNRKFDLLPIIIYSSVSQPSDIEFCFREGANLYTIKPTSFQELKEVLKRIFSIDWKKSMYYPPFPEFVIGRNSLGG
jgi:CheY-like chemotaxis protein